METEWPEHFHPNVVRDGYGGKLTSYTIALEAWRRGLNVTFLSPHIGSYRVSDHAGKSIEFLRSRPSLTSDAAIDLVNDKFQTSRILRESAVNVPHSVLLDLQVDKIAQVKAHAEAIGYPVVIKPLRGSMGKGVFTNIRTPDQLERRFDDMVPLTRGHYAVMESHVEGEDYRVLVIGGRYIGACKRQPASVTGNGRNTVEDLIAAKNRLRRENPFLSKGLIKPDSEVMEFLRNQGHSMTTVPSQGEHLQLRSAANASAGGDVIDVTEELPLAVRQAAVNAVDAIPDLYCAGVDVLYNPEAEGSSAAHYIIEINGHPQIGVNMFPTQGVGQDVPKHYIDGLFQDYPRSDDPMDIKLALPRLNELLSPLRAGMASEITISPLPPHKFRTRLLFTLQGADTMTPTRRNSLRRNARKYGIAGFYRSRSQDTAELLVAGTPQSVEDYSRVAAAAFNASVTASEEWSGPVSAGFYIARQQ